MQQKLTGNYYKEKYLITIKDYTQKEIFLKFY